VNIIYTDVLVIGGGLAGLRMGIGAKRRGHDVVIISLVPAKRSHSAAAQGGMQASLGNVIKGYTNAGKRWPSSMTRVAATVRLSAIWSPVSSSPMSPKPRRSPAAVPAVSIERPRMQ
jgi:succinate dehydrogenase/fumarate reductase flavoprotein subunit